MGDCYWAQSIIGTIIGSSTEPVLVMVTINRFLSTIWNSLSSRAAAPSATSPGAHAQRSADVEPAALLVVNPYNQPVKMVDLNGLLMVDNTKENITIDGSHM